MIKASVCLALIALTAPSAFAQAPAPAAPPQPRVASVNSQPRVDVSSMARPIDMHDSVWIEDLTMLDVRDLIKAGKFVINGVPLAPIEKTIENGKKRIEFRTDATVAATKKAMGK